MELRPFKTRRVRKAQEQINETAGRVASEIIDHIEFENPGSLRVLVGQAPRGIAPGEFLGSIAAQATFTLAIRAPRYADRLAYDSEASHRVSTERRDVGHYDWEHAVKPEGLTVVMSPVSNSKSIAA